MKKHIALLRGINVSGKNKISMSELKANFIELGFIKVSTYLNSGNVIFLSDIDNLNVLTNTIELMIKNKFKLDIPVLIFLQKEIKNILDNAPDWWGNKNKEIYDNLIFMFPSLSYNELLNEIGNPKENMKEYIIIKILFFGPLVVKIIKKQIGGQKPPLQI